MHHAIWRKIRSKISELTVRIITYHTVCMVLQYVCELCFDSPVRAPRFDLTMFYRACVLHTVRGLRVSSVSMWDEKNNKNGKVEVLKDTLENTITWETFPCSIYFQYSSCQIVGRFATNDTATGSIRDISFSLQGMYRSMPRFVIRTY